jgi:hypothetical protein
MAKLIVIGLLPLLLTACNIRKPMGAQMCAQSFMNLYGVLDEVPNMEWFDRVAYFCAKINGIDEYKEPVYDYSKHYVDMGNGAHNHPETKVIALQPALCGCEKRS